MQETELNLAYNLEIYGLKVTQESSEIISCVFHMCCWGLSLYISSILLPPDICSHLGPFNDILIHLQIPMVQFPAFPGSTSQHLIK